MSVQFWQMLLIHLFASFWRFVLGGGFAQVVCDTGAAVIRLLWLNKLSVDFNPRPGVRPSP